MMDEGSVLLESLETEVDLDRALSTAYEGLTVVYLWGHQCPNCEIFAAHLPGLRKKLEGLAVRFLKANVYAIDGLAERFGLHGIPTFYLYRTLGGGRAPHLLGRMTSFQGDDFFLQVIREQLVIAGSIKGS